MILFRRRKVFVCVAGLVLSAAVLYAAVGTAYQATMKVMVRRGRTDAPVSASENAPLDLTRMAISEEELNSEVELLRDHEVLRQVVEETGTRGRDWLHVIRMGEGRDQRAERVARRLAKKLKIEPIKRTNLISISYTGGDPQMAAKILRSLAKSYLSKHAAVHRLGGERQFFEQQTAESRRAFEESQRKLLQFGTARGVVVAAQQRDLALQKMSELDASARQTHIELAETEQRLRELEEKVQDLPQRTTTQVRTADNPELLKALNSSLLELQLKRIQVLTKFEPGHRLVQEIEQQIAQTQSSITAAQSSPVIDETTDRNSHYEWAKLELERAQVQLKALQAREAATLAAQAGYRSLTQKLGEDAITQEDLLSTEKLAQENFLRYVKKQQEARMSDALDEGGIVNAVIAEQPIAPALPVWPAWTVVTLGFVAAVGGGTGAALAADYLDPGFRDPQDVSACLEVPVLASLPSERPRRLSA
jgi:uncharacterized protein involved in exopolysaccharide biosynthesis